MRSETDQEGNIGQVEEGMEKGKVQGNVSVHDRFPGFCNIILRWFSLKFVIRKIGHCLLPADVLCVDRTRHNLIQHCNKGIEKK